MASIPSIKSLILDLPPSCIEFCPIARDHFVVGTYFLEKKEEEASVEENEDLDGETGKKPQTRTGSLILFKVDGDEVIEVQTLPTPHAILDLHFSPHDQSLLAVASSTGTLSLYRLSTSSSSATLTLQHHFQIVSSSTLVLSLCWHPKESNLIGVTLSTGEVMLFDISNTKGEAEGKEILQHDLEAWTLNFSPDGSSLFSGGDDATLRFSNGILSPTSEEEAANLQWSDRRAHTAGVTAILPLEHETDVLVTGSYDDNIRVLKAPVMGRRQVLAEENLEGGVWRLKLLRSDVQAGRYVVLASCMHAGARIVEVKRDGEGQWEIDVLAKFEEHKSMNYGSDVQPECGDEQTVISTSFYDKLLCLWRFTLP